MQAALERELADEEAKVNTEESGTDKTMGGTDDKEDEDDASDNGSEDLEAESSEDDDEEEDEEGGEAEEDVEMGEGDDKSASKTTNGESHAGPAKQEVMAH